MEHAGVEAPTVETAPAATSLPAASPKKRKRARVEETRTSAGSTFAVTKLSEIFSLQPGLRRDIRGYLVDVHATKTVNSGKKVLTVVVADEGAAVHVSIW